MHRLLCSIDICTRTDCIGIFICLAKLLALDHSICVTYCSLWCPPSCMLRLAFISLLAPKTSTMADKIIWAYICKLFVVHPGLVPAAPVVRSGGVHDCCFLILSSQNGSYRRVGSGNFLCGGLQSRCIHHTALMTTLTATMPFTLAQA